MSILKRDKWWIWLILLFFSNSTSILVLGALVDVYDKDAWYAKWQYWVIGLLLFVFPFFIMFTVFQIEILCKTCAKLKVDGKELYLSPYIWILLFIIPIFGWILLLVMFIYLNIMYVIELKRGSGEKYIK